MSEPTYYILSCKVVPKAQRSAVVGWEGDTLKVRLAAVPEKGKANDELLRCLAEALKVPRSRLELVSGLTSRLKRVKILGITSRPDFSN